MAKKSRKVIFYRVTSGSGFWDYAPAPPLDDYSMFIDDSENRIKKIMEKLENDKEGSTGISEGGDV